MKDVPTPPSDERLTGRIYGEYLEMPGLQLTCAQARRLFGLDEVQCAMVLEHLVARQFLVRRPDGRYARSTDGETRTRSMRGKRAVAALAKTA